MEAGPPSDDYRIRIINYKAMDRTKGGTTRTSRKHTFGAGSNIVESTLFCKLKIII
jgi:hypothetical protein